MQQNQTNAANATDPLTLITPEQHLLLLRTQEQFDDDHKQLTKDVELKVLDTRQEIEDERVGNLYMMVYDAFNEVYGVYPDALVVNSLDRKRLGQMMNLAMQGYRFDI